MALGDSKTTSTRTDEVMISRGGFTTDAEKVGGEGNAETNVNAAEEMSIGEDVLIATGRRVEPGGGVERAKEVSTCAGI